MLSNTRRVINSPFAVLREVDRALNDVWSNVENNDTASAGFPVDIREVDDTLVVEANRTGTQTETPKGETHVHERRHHHLVRRFSLPSAYNADEVDATLADGVLKLTLPKREEVKPRKIQVK